MELGPAVVPNERDYGAAWMRPATNPFGCEHRANRLRVERLSRVEGGKKEMEIMGDVVRVRQ